MKKLSFLFCSLLAGLFTAQAQEYLEVSFGTSYSNMAFFSLDDGETTTMANTSWDLAFVTAPGGAGIHLNEAAKSVMAGPIPELRLWLAPTDDFTATIDPADLTDSLYNTEISWEDGAFNSVKDPGTPDDYGWGLYDSGSGVIEGNRVFALQLRDGAWKKLQILALIDGVYTLKYADLDGANEVTGDIDKADYADTPLVLFSFTTGQAFAAPANWDLLFTRYRDALSTGDETVQYPVTGVLNAPGLEVAEARDINPLDVDYLPYLDSLETELDVIGQDWKYFDLTNFVWVIDLTRAYFIKLPDEHLWQVFFLDFEGSGTGVTLLGKTDLGSLSSIDDPESNFSSAGLFPNPAQGQFTVSFSLKNRQERLPLTLLDQLGRIVWRTEIVGQSGLNVLQVPIGNLPTGLYRLVLGQGRDRWASPVVVE